MGLNPLGLVGIRGSQISDSRKIKKMSRKQLRTIVKRDPSDLKRVV